MSSRQSSKRKPATKPPKRQEKTETPETAPPSGTEAWTSASKNPPSAEATPTAQPETQTEAEQHGLDYEELRKISADIKRQIHGISTQCKTTLRAILDRYPQCVSRSLADEGDARLPRTIRQHVRNHDRSNDSGFGDLLCFHVGSTILAFYAAVNGEDHEHLRARLQHLKEINEHGPGEYVPYGSDAHGWMLMHKTVARKKITEDRQREEERREKRHGV